MLLALPSGPPAAAEKVPARASLEAAMGKALFKRNWVPAPSSTKSNDGLGPLFNARSCLQCHAAATAGKIETGEDGRLAERGAVVRLGGENGAPDPGYGAQVQTRAVQNHAEEANVEITWEERQVALADGTHVALRRPVVTLQAKQGPLSTQSGRALVLAPSLAGAAQIAQVDLKALEQQLTVSGRVSRDKQGQVLVFGRKASQPDLTHAVEMAFARDLGMSTRGLPNPAGDCTALQPACLAGPHGGDEAGIEIAPEIVASLVAYVASLAPGSPAPADAGGAALFEATGCASCHRPTLPGKEGQPVTLYSDLLLHDLGAGLAGIPEVQGQTAAEWRTAPLVGLQKRLAAGSTLLHDGRARSVEEAVLWHGGQAQDVRDAYGRLTAAERRALQDFVLSR
jgi:CxxC motif-containing protein (DUF1111 family)